MLKIRLSLRIAASVLDHRPWASIDLHRRAYHSSGSSSSFDGTVGGVYPSLLDILIFTVLDTLGSSSEKKKSAEWFSTHAGSDTSTSYILLHIPPPRLDGKRKMSVAANSPKIASARLNVLVYSGALSQSAWRNNSLTADPGNGSTVESVRQCLYTLRRLLAPHYAVIPVTGDMIIKEPWTASCALFVMPGGADQGYCRTLNGEGNRRIAQYVRRGGAYLGFCAGGYYGSNRCEFEVGDKTMEVVGDRELAFFPGICRGSAFPGFVYHSEAGARAAELKVSKSALSVGTVPHVFKTYYNGGGVFVDAPKYADRGVEVLASYTEELHVDPGEGAAAVVYCKVGEGAAILTGPHPEFVIPG